MKTNLVKMQKSLRDSMMVPKNQCRKKEKYWIQLDGKCVVAM